NTDPFTAIPEAARKQSRELVAALLKSPYPFAHHLAAVLADGTGDADSLRLLVAALDGFVQSSDTVGFHAAAEALGHRRSADALPSLLKYAAPENPPGPVFGPRGMAFGWSASRAAARIIADARDDRIARLLASDNVWLQSGAITGLLESR